MAKGKTKSLRKHFLLHCGACNTQQSALRAVCTHCGEALHPDLEPEELEAIVDKVGAMEAAMKVVGEPQKGNPYGPVDDAYKRLKALARYDGFPGMNAFAAEIRARLLPHKVAVLKRTFNANVVFLLVLALFPVLPIIVGWPFMVTGLLCLPVLVWGGITFKAWRDYQRALAQQT